MSPKRSPAPVPKPPKKPLPDDPEIANEVGTDDFTRASIVRSPSGSSYFQPVEPSGLARLSDSAQEHLAQLQRLVLERQELLHQINDLIPELRYQGVSWGLIGWSVGTSSEAARQRWGKAAEEALDPPKPERRRRRK